MKSDWQNTAVVIPVYNAEKYLNELITGIKEFFPKESIFAVNDASVDNSSRLCHELGVNVIDFSENRGKGAALQAGFAEAIRQGFVFALTLDSDLQHKPKDIPRFIKEQNESGSAMVIGQRDFCRKIMPLARIFSNCTTSKIVSWVAGQDIVDSQSGYRLYDLRLIDELQFKSNRYQFETEVIIKFARLKGRISFLPIDTIYCDEVSYISHFRDIWNFIRIIIYEMFHKQPALKYESDVISSDN